MSFSRCANASGGSYRGPTTDGFLYCGTGTCKGNCGLVVEIPTKFFESF